MQVEHEDSPAPAPTTVPPVAKARPSALGAIIRGARRQGARYMPTREGLEANRFVRPFAGRVLRSELWRFTRRSVPRGVALGILCGFTVPVLQPVAAAFLALPIRANVPLAFAWAFLTNPFTLPFFFWSGNVIGKFVLRIDEMASGTPLASQMESTLGDWLVWAWQVASVTALGFVIQGVVLAAIGYLVSSFIWRHWVARKRRARIGRALALRRALATPAANPIPNSVD